MTGKVAIVTGASRGLGREMALGLSEVGAPIVVVGRGAGAFEFKDRALP